MSKNEKAIATLKQEPDALAALFDSSEMAGLGTGFENVRRQDVIIPRLTTLQGLSPQVTRGKTEYMPDAKVGQICDVALGEVWDTIEFLPVHYSVQWIVWAPRNSGRGLVRIMDTPPDASTYTVNENGQWVEKGTNNLIQETPQMFGFNLTAAGRPSFIPFASTSIKSVRKWMTTATNISVANKNGDLVTPPLFAYSYTLDTVPMSNAKGSWMAIRATISKPITELGNAAARLSAIKSFRASLASGELKADLEREDTHEGRTVHSDDDAM